MVLHTTCTFCFVTDETDEPATTPIPITLTVNPHNSGFSFTYDPDNFEGDDAESTRANACDKHAAAILPMLESFKLGIIANIVDPVKIEESGQAEGVDDTPDDYDLAAPADDQEDDELGDELDEEDAAAVVEHLENEALKRALGRQADQEEPPPSVTTVPQPDLMSRIQSMAVPKAMGVSNPEPGEADEDARINAPEFSADAWRADFAEGYTPDVKSLPKGEERVACKQWYDSLSDSERTLAGNWTPKLTKVLINYWRKSALFADNYYVEEANA